MSIEDALIRDEGVRLFPYTDTVGVLTIGVGRAIGRVGISHEEALYLLRNDIARVQKELAQAFPFYAHLSPVRQEVVENMCFNLGLAGLKTFRATLAYLAAGNYQAAATAMTASKWAHQVGRRAVRLAYMMAHDEEIPPSQSNS